MAKSRNKKGMVPWYPSREGYPIRRKPFLDATRFEGPRAYFGPGHRQDVALGSYYAPTDWRPAGAILTAPEVVWLNVYFEFGTYPPATVTTTDYVYWPDTRFSTSVAFRSPTPADPWFYGDHFTTTVTNPEITERLRLLGVYAEVKSRIEALRPKRTWVMTQDWNDQAVPPAHFCLTDGMLPFVAPPDVAPGTYYGTKFLNVWGGHNARMYYGSISVVPVQAYVAEPVPEDDPWYGLPKARIRRAFPAMSALGHRFYGPDCRWGPPSPPWPAESWQDHIHLNTPLNNVDQVDSEAQLELFADDMGTALDGRYMGGTSEITVDSLVELIAGYFHFDKRTGKDLP